MYRTVTCLHLEEELQLSLSSLLKLLEGYLDHDWDVDTIVSAHTGLVLIGLDDTDHAGPLSGLAPGALVVGVARRPRVHAAGTIHRPLRSYEVFAQLKEAERRIAQVDSSAGNASANPAALDLAQDDSRTFRLETWPHQFIAWPRSWWCVMAALRPRQLTIGQLTLQTGLDRQTVAQCLDALLSIAAVSVKFDLARMHQKAPPPRKSLWTRIGARVSTLLRNR